MFPASPYTQWNVLTRSRCKRVRRCPFPHLQSFCLTLVAIFSCVCTVSAEESGILKYYPASGSPVIDAGVSTVGGHEIVEDILGNPIYGAPDLGPFEYQPPYTMGDDLIGVIGRTFVYADGRFRIESPEQSGGARLCIVPRDGFEQQNRGAWLLIEVILWNDGTGVKKWKEERSAFRYTIVEHVVGDLKAGQAYGVYYASNGGPQLLLARVVANAGGVVKFSHSDRSGQSEFEVKESPMDEFTPISAPDLGKGLWLNAIRDGQPRLPAAPVYGLPHGDGVTYYVDSDTGNDTNSGSYQRPWKTISKVNEFPFGPGDKVLLKRGQVFRERLHIKNWNSTYSQDTVGAGAGALVISAYGDGRRPEITALDKISSMQTSIVIGGNTVRWHWYDEDLNSGFEEQKQGGWKAIASQGNEVVRASGVSHGGTKSMRLSKAKPGECCLYTNVKLKPGMRYALSFWYQGMVGSVLNLRYCDPRSGKYLSADPSADGGALETWRDSETVFQRVTVQSERWTRHSIIVSYHPDMEEGVLSFELGDAQRATQVIYVDDVNFYPRWTPHPTTKDLYGIHLPWDNAYHFFFLLDGEEISVRSQSTKADGLYDENRLDEGEYCVSVRTPSIFWLKTSRGNPDYSGQLVEGSVRSNAATIENSRNVVLDNLIITGTSVGGTGALSLKDRAAHITAQNSVVQLGREIILRSDPGCEKVLIQGNEVRWGGWWGIDVKQNYLIRNNRVHHIGFFPRYLIDGHGIGGMQASDSIIEKNECYANGRYTRGPALSLFNSRDCIVRYNYLHDNYRGGMFFAGGSTGMRIHGNILSNNGKGRTVVTDWQWANMAVYFHFPVSSSQYPTYSTSNLVYNNIVFKHQLWSLDPISLSTIASRSDHGLAVLMLRNNVIVNDDSDPFPAKRSFLSIFESGGEVKVESANNLFTDGMLPFAGLSLNTLNENGLSTFPSPPKGLRVR